MHRTCYRSHQNMILSSSERRTTEFQKPYQAQAYSFRNRGAALSPRAKHNFCCMPWEPGIYTNTPWGGHFRNQETHNHQMRIIGSHRRLHRRVKLKMRQVGQPTKNKWQYHTNITMKRCACESRQNDASILCHKWICCEIRNGHCEYKHTRHSNWAQNLPVQNKGSTLWFQKDTHQPF